MKVQVKAKEAGFVCVRECARIYVCMCFKFSKFTVKIKAALPLEDAVRALGVWVLQHELDYALVLKELWLRDTRRKEEKEQRRGR